MKQISIGIYFPLRSIVIGAHSRIMIGRGLVLSICAKMLVAVAAPWSSYRHCVQFGMCRNSLLIIHSHMLILFDLCLCWVGIYVGPLHCLYSDSIKESFRMWLLL